MIGSRYQEVKRNQVPVVTPQPGVEVRVICGTVNGVKGPVENIVADPEYLDITLGPDITFSHPVNPDYTVAAYVIGGKGLFDMSSKTSAVNREMVLFRPGTGVQVRSSPEGVRFLLFSGKKIHEPIAWRGPIVMNTQEELAEAFREYREGTFIKKKGVR